jgi:hypothetical protein
MNFYQCILKELRAHFSYQCIPKDLSASAGIFGEFAFPKNLRGSEQNWPARRYGRSVGASGLQARTWPERSSQLRVESSKWIGSCKAVGGSLDSVRDSQDKLCSSCYFICDERSTEKPPRIGWPPPRRGQARCLRPGAVHPWPVHAKQADGGRADRGQFQVCRLIPGGVARDSLEFAREK